MTTTPTTPTSGAADLPAIISGALFDFAGFLTTLDKSRAVTFSGAHEAGPAVTLLQEWSTKRGLNLDEADVSGWRSALPAQAISAEPAGAGYAAWPEPEVHDEGGWHITYYTATMMRDFADSTHTLRASHGQAPARDLAAVIKGAADKLDAAVCCHPNAVDTLIHEALEILDGDREPDATPTSRGQGGAA